MLYFCPYPIHPHFPVFQISIPLFLSTLLQIKPPEWLADPHLLITFVKYNFGDTSRLGRSQLRKRGKVWRRQLEHIRSYPWSSVTLSIKLSK